MSRLSAFLFRLIVKITVCILGLTVALVILFAFVPVPITATMILDKNGSTRDWERIENIDPNLVAAVIAAEDAKFCSHSGFDTQAINAAIANNARVKETGKGRIYGASTITQQTAKNVFLWQDGGYVRKGLEAWFAFWIEQVWGKRRIMEVYLNVAETGIGTYGAAAGAQRYFGTSAAHLSPAQAARMAVALPSPKTRPVKAPKGWLANHARQIQDTIAIVQRDGLDDCVYP